LAEGETKEIVATRENVHLTAAGWETIKAVVPKTLEAALVVAQAYLLTTQPVPGDPREGMH
jgi:hypothetical protein